jgi:hypothetical protein
MRPSNKPSDFIEFEEIIAEKSDSLLRRGSIKIPCKSNLYPVDQQYAEIDYLDDGEEEESDESLDVLEQQERAFLYGIIQW